MLITMPDLPTLKNVSRAAVTKKIKTGKLEGAIVNHNGRKLVNKEEAFRLWDLQASPSKDTTVRKKLKEEIDSKTLEEIPSYGESKAKREYFLAELAKIDVEQKREQVIDVEIITKSAFAKARAIRASLENIADRLSHQLAGEDNPSAIHKILTEEHREALENLAS